MKKRIYNIFEIVPGRDRTYRELIHEAENHEIHLWRVTPGEWIYPHIHPHSDDIWYIVEGEGEYYTSAEEIRKVRAGDLAIASPREVHGIFNCSAGDIVILSVLSPLPVETDEAPGFKYPV
jgi:mannose-6-phosphate isomerase-like protein (cupin superfamily)